jgi:hypothetical protein
MKLSLFLSLFLSVCLCLSEIAKALCFECVITFLISNNFALEIQHTVRSVFD